MRAAAVLTALLSLAGSAEARTQTRDQDVPERLRAAQAAGLDVRLPPADSVTMGDRTIPAGATVRGPVVTMDGDLEIRGTIDGNAVAIDGDVIVAQGGTVTGDAISVGGTVQADGTVLGEIRRMTGDPAAAGAAQGAASASPWSVVQRRLGIAVGILTMLAIISVGVMMFAGEHLEAISVTVQQRFTRSFIVGVLGQLAILPVLVLTLIGLVLTLIGILLIPFAIVAYVIALFGLLTLGFLAMCRVSGSAIIGANDMPYGTRRKWVLRSLVVGLVAYMGLWLIAGAFAFNTLASGILLMIAATVTWVAVTAGFGATLITRAGTRRIAVSALPPELDEAAWITPTPVTGVAAARRAALQSEERR